MFLSEESILAPYGQFDVKWLQLTFFSSTISVRSKVHAANYMVKNKDRTQIKIKQHAQDQSRMNKVIDNRFLSSTKSVWWMDEWKWCEDVLCTICFLFECITVQNQWTEKKRVCNNEKREKHHRARMNYV